MRAVAERVKERGGIRLADGAAGCRREWLECRATLGRAGIGVFASARKRSALRPDEMAAALGMSDTELLDALLDEYHRPQQAERTMLQGLADHEAEQVAQATIYITWDTRRKVWSVKDWTGDEVLAHWDAWKLVEKAKEAGCVLSYRETK